ncbi:MAG: hypothetical protein G01um101438_971 [Parcubacteria group bacterium Gr01-1014_38]|nr:MAG: hypothetical protein G01um101438_971 [Parcubacteria group bacterium Gr01-1014_38]
MTLTDGTRLRIPQRAPQINPIRAVALGDIHAFFAEQRGLLCCGDFRIHDGEPAFPIDDALPGESADASKENPADLLGGAG